METDLIISGKSYVNGTVGNMEIGITDGKITEVGRALGRADRRIDFHNKLILPGFVDPHVHLRDPGLTHKEDFSTGTMSALHGGVTTVLDMPNTVPPISDVRTLQEKKRIVKKRAFTDYGLFAAITPNCNAALLAPLVCGFKLFMGSTTGNILMNDDAEIAAVMGGIKSTGLTMSVHAEDDSMILKDEENSCRDHLANRPVTAEYNAIRRLSKFKGMNINICHCTDPASVDLANEFGFTSEVTLHHMLFEIGRNSTAEYKVNPPLRTIDVRDALFKKFTSGEITMFGSDHAPHTIEEKSRDFNAAPGGIPGVETTMPIVMNLVRRDIIPISLAMRMGAEAPADRFGLNKGRIEVGRDADLAIVDMHTPEKIDIRKLHSKAGHSPYAGMEAMFPETVIIRGNVQISEGEFCGERIGEDICDKLRS